MIITISIFLSRLLIRTTNKQLFSFLCKEDGYTYTHRITSSLVFVLLYWEAEKFINMSLLNNGKDGFQSQFSFGVEGITTEVVFHQFANKWFLIVTQYERLPNLYVVKFDVDREQRIIPVLNGPNNDPQLYVSVPITMQCSFGADTDETRSGIQFLVNNTGLNKCPTEVLITLGLKEINGQILRQIANVLKDIM